eukprot:5755799-Heterocapsa_arctica.AAC.1
MKVRTSDEPRKQQQGGHEEGEQEAQAGRLRLATSMTRRRRGSRAGDPHEPRRGKRAASGMPEEAHELGRRGTHGAAHCEDVLRFRAGAERPVGRLATGARPRVAGTGPGPPA